MNSSHNKDFLQDVVSLASPLYQCLSPMIVMNPVLRPLQVWQRCCVRCSFLTVKEREGNRIAHKPFPFCPPSSVSNSYPISCSYFSTHSRTSCKHTFKHRYFYNINNVIVMLTFPVPKIFHGCVKTSIRMIVQGRMTKLIDKLVFCL